MSGLVQNAALQLQVSCWRGPRWRGPPTASPAEAKDQDAQGGSPTTPTAMRDVPGATSTTPQEEGLCQIAVNTKIQNAF